MTEFPPWRKIITEQLQMLASPQEQLEYEQNVPHVDITRELVSGWFDDSYHAQEDKFRRCFSEMELEALSRFNAIFEAQLVRLPPSNGTVRTWLASEGWCEVIAAARGALHEIRA